MGGGGEEGRKKERKRERKNFVTGTQKHHVWGDSKKRVLPWRILCYRSPSSFEPLSTIVQNGTWGGGRAAEVAAGTRDGVVAGRVGTGDLLTWVGSQCAEVPSADRSRTDAQGSSRAQCRAAVLMEQGGIQKDQPGMCHPLRVSGNT